MAAKPSAALLHPPDNHAPPLWRDSLFWLALLLSLFAVAPFMLPGYFWGANDARHHVYFLFEYDRLVQDGIWWPRWSPDFAFGYGYPFFNIYGPLSHFLAELLLRFLGFSHVAAIKTVFGFSIVASAAAMYAFGRAWLGRGFGLVAAVAYVYAPYHLLNLYVRANLAESMAFVWLPLCLLAVRQATLRRSFGWLLAAALSYAGLMLTSNLVFVLFTPLLGLYLLVLILTQARPAAPTAAARLRAWVGRGLAPVLGLSAGLGLSAVFWLPMALERQHVRVDQWFDGRYAFQNNFVYFHQLFSPRWGFGISEAGPDDPIGFQLGAALLAFAAVGLLTAWPRLARADRWQALCFAAAAAVAAFFGLTWSQPLWNLPLIGAILGFAQFPWRWFSITTLCLSVLAGFAVLPFAGRARRSLDLPLLAVALLLLLGSYPLLQVQIVPPAEGPVSLAGLMRFQRSSDEMTGSTAWVSEIPTWSPMAEHYIAQDEAGGPVEPVTTKLDYGVFDYETFAASSVAHNTVMEEVHFFNHRSEEQRIVFQHFYYPGWKAYLLDGEHGRPIQELPIIPEETGTLGRMTVPVPTGEGYLLLRFEDTPPRVVGRFISLATALLLLLAGLLLALRRSAAYQTHLKNQGRRRTWPTEAQPPG